MGCVMDINTRSMMAFDNFIKLKYQDGVLWNHGKPTHPLYIDLWASWQQAQKVAVPEGYVVVPREPTKKMIDAGVDNAPETPSQDYWHSSQPLDDEQAEACYKAMIEAVEKN